MVLVLPGLGFQYGVVATDATGAYLDGGKTYQFTIHREMPAKDFWSMVVDDFSTNSKRDGDMIVNADGAVVLTLNRQHQQGRKPTGFRPFLVRPGSLCFVLRPWRILV